MGLETDQGLVFTRMAVVNNIDEIMELSHSISMEGGNEDICQNVQKLSAAIETTELTTITPSIADINPDQAFGYRRGDVGEMMLAVAVLQGQLGTPSGSVRYYMFLADDSCRPFNGATMHLLTVPTGLLREKGCCSISNYGVDDKLLIPDSQQFYDRTTYASEQNIDGFYIITLSSAEDGINDIPIGK